MQGAATNELAPIVEGWTHGPMARGNPPRLVWVGATAEEAGRGSGGAGARAGERAGMAGDEIACREERSCARALRR